MADTPKATDTKQEKAFLLFALWFRGETGVQHYREWLEAASPVAEKYGARRVEFMVPVEIVRGTFDPDYISVVEWPSVQHYYDFVKDIQYQALRDLREAAIRKTAIIHCRRTG